MMSAAASGCVNIAPVDPNNAPDGFIFVARSVTCQGACEIGQLTAHYSNLDGDDQRRSAGPLVSDQGESAAGLAIFFTTDGGLRFDLTTEDGAPNLDTNVVVRPLSTPPTGRWSGSLTRRVENGAAAATISLAYQVFPLKPTPASGS